MAEGDLRGLCPPRFAAVRDAFAANFAEGREIGARFALAVGGEIVVDLIGGWADRAATRPFDETTLCPVFSTGKALAALMVARLVDKDRLDYDQPAADVWPEFARAGKGAITVADALSHQAGLVGFAEPMDPDLWLDWNAICERLEAMAPLWPPGAHSGYHPVTFGYLAGEIFRRVDGRRLGAAFREDIAAPLGLDAWIGLPDSEAGRVAEIRRPPAMPDLGPITEPKRLAFLTRWAQPGGRDDGRLRRADIPSVTGYATAPALARVMAILANDGRLDGRTWLRSSTIAEAARTRIAGEDLVLPFDLSWGAGFLRNERLKIYGPGLATFGHSGWGGSCAFADPETGLSGAYVMNRQSADLFGDFRSRRLIDAAYEALG
jgi:CubicO group peptidase (beta-lactamase class C family)